MTNPSKRTRVLTGIQPTGDLHLGNYVGAIRPCVEFSKHAEHEVILMCADWHGLTNKARLREPGENTLTILSTLLAFDFNVENNCLIVQSHFPEIQEMAWYLACVTGVGILERAHAYKDAVQNGRIPTAGLLNYPVLMTSDIITFDGAQVPVGPDQAQHLEYASDIVKLFNNAVNAQVLTEPKPLFRATELLMGIDGERKMSKSYDNTIPLFGNAKETEKRIKAVKTDSRGLNDPKDPKTCLIFQLFKAFGSDEAVNHMREKLEKGTGYGYGHAKNDFIEEFNRVFGARRALFDHYVNTPSEVWKKIEPGYEKATRLAKEICTRARDALGLRPRGL